MSTSKPYVTIIEQPAGKSQRFRYLSEVDGARSVGSIPGVNSTSERRTYPTIRVEGHKGPFLVLLSLLNPNNNLVHPHSITGSDPRYTCRNGVIFVISDEPEVVFKNIGILCVKGKTEVDVKSALKLRREINIDPFGAGFSHINDHSQIDFTAVRLCFQVCLPGPGWTKADQQDLLKYSKSLAPIASDVVYDAKKLNDLKIVHVTYCAGPLTGGTEMTLLCDKYTGQNPDVVFEDGRGWKQTAAAKMHHKQLAIVFVAPPYREERDPRSPDYLQVQVYLQQTNERGGGVNVLCSQRVTVEYLPKAPEGSSLQLPTPRPPTYPATIYAKGIRGRGMNNATRSDNSPKSSTSRQAPPDSPYANIKMSPVTPGIVQEFSPPVVNAEPDFSAYNSILGQNVNNASGYRPSNIHGSSLISNINDITGTNMISNMNNIQGNILASSNTNNLQGNTHASVSTRMANLNLNPQPSTSRAPNVAPGTYKFTARIPPGATGKRSVNYGTPDSGELSTKRDKLMPLVLQDPSCNTSPPCVNLNNPFLPSNVQSHESEIPLPAACLPLGQENVSLFNPTLFQDILSDPVFGGVLDAVANMVHTETAWHTNILASMNDDQNNINLNNLGPTHEQNNIRYNNIDDNNVDLSVLINDAVNTFQTPANDADINVHMNIGEFGDQEQNAVQIDYETLSEELKLALNVSK